jgi:hypothetical protein
MTLKQVAKQVAKIIGTETFMIGMEHWRYERDLETCVEWCIVADFSSLGNLVRGSGKTIDEAFENFKKAWKERKGL